MRIFAEQYSRRTEERDALLTSLALSKCESCVDDDVVAQLTFKLRNLNLGLTKTGNGALQWIAKHCLQLGELDLFRNGNIC